MTPGAKQSELKRLKALVLATIDYQLELDGGSIISDGFDPLREYYEQQREQAEVNFRERRLNRLQRQLEQLTKGLWMGADLQFAGYIKERTGEDLDLFSEVSETAGRILAKGTIQSEEERKTVSVQLHILQQTKVEPEKQAILLDLLVDYCERRQQSEKTRTYTKVIKREENGCVKLVTVHITSSAKPAHDVEQVAISPDGKRRVRVNLYSQDEKSAYTYVNMDFPKASGLIYAVRGLHPGVKAYWKDNRTIVVETLKGLAAYTQHRTLQSFEDVVTIEYIII